MTDDRIPDHGPLFEPRDAPEHGPDFWDRLDATLASEPKPTSHTRQMPVAAAAGTQAVAAVGRPDDDPPRSWALPLAVAAAAIVLAGLGVFLALRPDGGDTSTTEIVAGPTDVPDSAPLDGPDTSEADTSDTATPAAAADTSSADTSDTETPAAAGGDTSDTDTSDTSDTSDTDTSDTSAGEAVASGDGENDEAVGETTGPTAVAPGPTVTPVPTATPVPPIPEFARAFGATGEPAYLPLDQGVPADATYLSNWTERALTFYGVTDSSRTCANANYAEIRYVNGSGLTQPVHDPQLRFSGEISHYTVQNDQDDDQDLAAWVVSCGTQLELYVAELDPTGEVVDLTLAWFGDGAVESALVLWDGTEVSLNAIEPGARSFAVSYDVETELVARNGGPSRIMLEEGAPAERSLTPLAATTDAGLTYWAGRADPGTVSACTELFGSGQSDMLWLRQGEGQWQPAVAGDFPVGTVTAAAIEPEFLQFAFADVCENEAGRVVIGTQLPDGRIGEPRVLDLTPYVPGYASQLFWVDSDTLRIVTDNSEYGFGLVRFDYRLDENIVVQL